jgi:hypothetical protein
VDAQVPSKRAEFCIPPTEAGEGGADGPRYRVAGTPSVYLCGNSLGLPPARTRAYVNAELDKWAQHGVEGHFKGVRAAATPLLR